ncbi:MAG: hypothetical protein ACOY4R_27555 [Pseudomonadota bacterium]
MSGGDKRKPSPAKPAALKPVGSMKPIGMVVQRMVDRLLAARAVNDA